MTKTALLLSGGIPSAVAETLPQLLNAEQNSEPLSSSVPDGPFQSDTESIIVALAYMQVLVREVSDSSAKGHLSQYRNATKIIQYANRFSELFRTSLWALYLCDKLNFEEVGKLYNKFYSDLLELPKQEKAKMFSHFILLLDLAEPTSDCPQSRVAVPQQTQDDTRNSGKKNDHNSLEVKSNLADDGLHGYPFYSDAVKADDVSSRRNPDADEFRAEDRFSNWFQVEFEKMRYAHFSGNATPGSTICTHIDDDSHPEFDFADAVARLPVPSQITLAGYISNTPPRKLH